MKPLCIILICLTTFALALYPFVLMANIMTIAAVQPPEPLPFGSLFFLSAFTWGSTLYPVAYLIGLIASIWNFRKHLRAAVFWQVGVIAYFFLVVAALFAALIWG